jgi:hypothetical protein
MPWMRLSSKEIKEIKETGRMHGGRYEEEGGRGVKDGSLMAALWKSRSVNPSHTRLSYRGRRQQLCIYKI